jgi:hypothetical protein
LAEQGAILTIRLKEEAKALAGFHRKSEGSGKYNHNSISYSPYDHPLSNCPWESWGDKKKEFRLQENLQLFSLALPVDTEKYD